MQLTKTQEGIINADIIIGGAVSTICGATFFPCSHSTEEIDHAANVLVRENDALRIRIDIRSRTQRVSAFKWRNHEVLHFGDRDEFESFAREYAKTRLDMNGPLFDLKIFTIGEETGLIYVFHHAVCDAWSLSVLRWQLYRILEEGAVPETGSFIEYCEESFGYLSSRRYKRDREYFLSRFGECRDRLTLPEPQSADHQSGSICFDVAPEIVKKLGRYSENTGISNYVLLLSSFGTCYGKLMDNAECFYLGTTILNRTAERDRSTAGPFIDDVPLLFDLDYDAGAADMIRKTDELVMEAFRHHRFNYPMLQEAINEGSSEAGLYDVIFNYQAEYEVVDSYTAEWFPNGSQAETLQVHIDHRNDRSGLKVTYNYLTGRYSDRDISRLHRHFMNVLDSMISDDSRILREIPMMDAEEMSGIMEMSQGPAYPVPDRSLYSVIEEQQNGRIIEGNREYSLDDLKKDAEKIDCAIRGEKRAIALICDRGYPELAAIYGIIRGGNAYIPVSPEFPAERIHRMIEISGCDTVLVQRKYRDLAKDGLVLEDLLEMPYPSVPLSANALPEDALYVIFTSGSTGEPKGAMVSNRSAVNRVGWMARRYFTRDSVIMLKTPYTFDVSVWEIFGFAMAGATLYILPPGDHYRQDRVAEHIRRGSVTDIHFVPAVYSSFLSEFRKEGKSLPSLKNIFLSGEALPAALLEGSPAAVHNLYGPTECTVDVTYHDCAPEEQDPIPIGTPIDNCSAYILNKDLQLMPLGAKGQICIGGVPVGMGYISAPKRTAEAFVSDPFGDGMLYMTGDTGYRREDGAIVFTGRGDRQVKINGQRVELGEIEAALAAFVSAAAVFIEDGKLTAVYTGDVRTDLREKLGAVLPGHMIPHSFIHLDTMPLTSSGKIDRRALPHAGNDDAEYVAPENGAERTICSLFSEVLKKERVGRNSSFFDLGGSSLDMVELLCRPPLDRLEPADFMAHSTPAELAELLLRKNESGGLDALYVPDPHFDSVIVLFPYGGGDASAYTALVEEFRRRKASAALYCVPWTADHDLAEKQIRNIAEGRDLTFYSHCAGAVSAMKLLDRLNADGRTVKRYIAAANIPPSEPVNIWEGVSDAELLDVLNTAGMPALAPDREADLVRRFRRDTEEYFDYIKIHTWKTPCSVEIVLSRDDLFTPDCQNAAELWAAHAESVSGIRYIDSSTHYFQSADARELAEILLSEV